MEFKQPSASIVPEIIEEFPSLEAPKYSLEYKLAIKRIKEALRRFKNIAVLPYHPDSYESVGRIYQITQSITTLIMECPEATFVIGHPFIQGVEYHLGLEVTKRLDLIHGTINVEDTHIYNIYTRDEIRGNYLRDRDLEDLRRRTRETKAKHFLEMLNNVNSLSEFNNSCTLSLRHTNGDVFLCPQNSRNSRANKFLGITSEGIAIAETNPEVYRGPGANGFLEIYPYLYPLYTKNIVTVSFTQLTERINTEIINPEVKRKKNPVGFLSRNGCSDFWKTVLVINEDYSTSRSEVILPGFWKYSELGMARLIFFPSLFKSL